MPATPSVIVIDPNGMTVSVDIADLYGTSVTSYTASGGASTHTLPKSISTATAFHLTAGGVHTVTATYSGVQIMSKQVDVGRELTVTVPKPSGVTIMSLLDDKSELTRAVTQATDDYTLVLADADRIVEVSKGSAVALTVPPAASVAFPTGTRLEVVQTGAGQVTLTAGAGVTIQKAAATLKLTAQWSVARLYKQATNVWVASGDLAAS